MAVCMLLVEQSDNEREMLRLNPQPRQAHLPSPPSSSTLSKPFSHDHPLWLSLSFLCMFHCDISPTSLDRKTFQSFT